MTDPIQRPTARILLADHRDHLLLFQGADGTWFTPGGGVDEGESVDAAAARELREETGHHVTPALLGPLVATTAGHWLGGWDGQLYYSVESYFFLRVPDSTIDTSGFTDYERTDITTHHWWSLPALRSTTENIIPWGLPALLERLFTGDIPTNPVKLPWHHPEFAHLVEGA